MVSAPVQTILLTIATLPRPTAAPPVSCAPWSSQEHWLVLKDSYMICARHDQSISWVILFDPDFAVSIVRASSCWPNTLLIHDPGRDIRLHCPSARSEEIPLVAFLSFLVTLTASRG